MTITKAIKDNVYAVKRLLEDNAAVLREHAGEYAQSGFEDISFECERAATFFDAALCCIKEGEQAMRRAEALNEPNDYDNNGEPNKPDESEDL